MKSMHAVRRGLRNCGREEDGDSETSSSPSVASTLQVVGEAKRNLAALIMSWTKVVRRH